MTGRGISSASGKRVLLALALFVAGSAFLFAGGPYQAARNAAGGPLPEESVSSAAELHRFIEELGPEGRRVYLGFQGWDLLNPMLIGFLGFALLTWLMKLGEFGASPMRHLVWLPLPVAASDGLENAVLARAVLSFPEASGTQALLPVLTSTKFALLPLMVLAIIGCAYRVVVARRGSEKR